MEEDSEDSVGTTRQDVMLLCLLIRGIVLDGQRCSLRRDVVLVISVRLQVDSALGLDFDLSGDRLESLLNFETSMKDCRHFGNSL